MKKLALVVVTPFSAFGHDYKTLGDVIPAEQYEKWPDGTLANRMNNGWVKWDSIEEKPESDVKPDVAKMTKDQLIQYAEERFDVTMDKRANEKTLRTQIEHLEQRRRATARPAAAVPPVPPAAVIPPAGGSTDGAGAGGADLTDEEKAGGGAPGASTNAGSDGSGSGSQ